MNIITAKVALQNATGERVSDWFEVTRSGFLGVMESTLKLNTEHTQEITEVICDDGSSVSFSRPYHLAPHTEFRFKGSTGPAKNPPAG